jgi:hypothetical protein
MQGPISFPHSRAYGLSYLLNIRVWGHVIVYPDRAAVWYSKKKIFKI